MSLNGNDLEGQLAEVELELRVVRLKLQKIRSQLVSTETDLISLKHSRENLIERLQTANSQRVDRTQTHEQKLVQDFRERLPHLKGI